MSCPGWSDHRPSDRPWSQQACRRPPASLPLSVTSPGGSSLCSWRSPGCSALAPAAQGWRHLLPGQCITSPWPETSRGYNVTQDGRLIQFWEPREEGATSEDKARGNSMVILARAQLWGLGVGRHAHLLLPPLQGGEVEDPEVSGNAPSREPPQQVHGTTASGHIGSCMEGAG